MNFEQLECLIELNKYGSITKASEELFMNRQTLSNQIKRLETELGFEIFKRSKQGVEFTEKGRKLLSFSDFVMKEYAVFRNDVGLTTRQALDGKINIVCTKSVEKIVSAAVEVFIKKYPNVNVFYNIESNAVTCKNVIDGFYDIGIFIKMKGKSVMRNI